MTHEIKVKFINGRSIVYSMGVFKALKTDPEVIQIYDNETGEVIYSNDIYYKAIGLYFENFKKHLQGV